MKSVCLDNWVNKHCIMLSLFVSSFSKNRICCWCNSVSLDRFAEDLKKHSSNELISLKIRSLISAIICNLRFSSSTLRFKAPSKFDWIFHYTMFQQLLGLYLQLADWIVQLLDCNQQIFGRMLICH